MEESDCERYVALLYLCNGTRKIRSDIFPRRGKASTVIGGDRGSSIVDIASYCLMPNHVHLMIREIDYGGISTFMQRLGTAYAMYFNKKYARTGALFEGKFKAKHVDSDAYFRRLFNYIHANPAELYEPKWKDGIVRKSDTLKKLLCSYPFSSLPDYLRIKRPHSAIISARAAMEQLEEIPSYANILKDARAFYRYEIGTGAN